MPTSDVTVAFSEDTNCAIGSVILTVAGLPLGIADVSVRLKRLNPVSHLGLHGWQGPDAWLTPESCWAKGSLLKLLLSPELTEYIDPMPYELSLRGSGLPSPVTLRITWPVRIEEEVDDARSRANDIASQREEEERVRRAEEQRLRDEEEERGRRLAEEQLRADEVERTKAAEAERLRQEELARAKDAERIRQETEERDRREVENAARVRSEEEAAAARTRAEEEARRKEIERTQKETEDRKRREAEEQVRRAEAERLRLKAQEDAQRSQKVEPVQVVPADMADARKPLKIWAAGVASLVLLGGLGFVFISNGPTALDYSFAVKAGETSTLHVLPTDNDTKKLTLASVDGSTLGSANIDRNEAITYSVYYNAAPRNGPGVDRFKYVIRDRWGRTATGSLTVSIDYRGSPPPVAAARPSAAAPAPVPAPPQSPSTVTIAKTSIFDAILRQANDLAKGNDRQGAVKLLDTAWHLGSGQAALIGGELLDPARDAGAQSDAIGAADRYRDASRLGEAGALEHLAMLKKWAKTQAELGNGSARDALTHMP